MDKEKLKQTLFGIRTRTYCLLDGAAVSGLPKMLFDTETPNYTLIGGELSPDMIHVVPYVAIMLPNSEFSEWILNEGLGKNWGIFVQSRYSLTEMRRHFRSMLNVHDESGKPMIFRYYDPRVIRKFLPTCDAEQVEAFFGKMDKYFVESEEPDIFLEFTQTNGELHQREIELNNA